LDTSDFNPLRPSVVFESRADTRESTPETLVSTPVIFLSRLSRISFISPSLVSIRAESASEEVWTVFRTYFLLAHPLVTTRSSDINVTIDSLCIVFPFYPKSPDRRTGTTSDLAKYLPFLWFL